MNDDDAPLPAMSDAVLDSGALDALLRDLAELATIEEILVKHGPGRVSPDAAPVTIAEVAELLRNGTARGVQVRYRHDGTRWIDTLMPLADGVRLVRVAAPR